MKSRVKSIETKVIFVAVILLFFFFLAVPIGSLLLKSFPEGTGSALSHYREVLSGKGFWIAVGHSFAVAGSSACLTTILAFFLAYTVQYTNVPEGIKKIIHGCAVLPMLLPTITYGFAIIYTFGKQGMITKIIGTQIFNIYGFGGLLLGYMIYTLPVSYLLIHNTMGYIDKKFMIVSRVMGDTPWKTFCVTILRPLMGTLAASFVQCFFLAFTDFGIPASVGGQYEVVASVLYDEMLGSLPNFNNGAVVSLVMLVPSIISIALLQYLGRFNVRYNKISDVENTKNGIRDGILGIGSMLVILLILIVFLVIAIVPFVEEWPYKIQFTWKHVREVFCDGELLGVFGNSLLVAVLTAVFGSLIAYGAALVTARSQMCRWAKQVIESIALVTNTIPGMVIGIAFMLVFAGTSLQNTCLLIILCNIVHYFSTPYLMMKNSLEKLNRSWETTAMLMGDNWLKTIARVVTPNVIPTIIEAFCYYFVNVMVTVSAVIFIVGAKTMVVTAKIKELQHFAKFNEIFVLSLCILLTNLVVKGVFHWIEIRIKKSREKSANEVVLKSKSKKTVIGLCLAVVIAGIGMGIWFEKSNESEQEAVVIYSNADDEAVEAMKNTLDENGYAGQYVFQSFGTSELGGKLLAEGTDIEADLVTMSSFYLESAQSQNKMFTDLTFEAETVTPTPSYYKPITCQEGAIIVNTQAMEEEELPMPESIKDLANPIYEGELSVTDIKSSSTAWLMIQAIISEYGEEEGAEILSGIYKNAGPHIEDSGSGPIKKVRSGEVAIGFGLRHQAVEDQQNGLSIGYVDPIEGNFSLTESIAVIDKGEYTNPKAMEMAECIIRYGREKIQKTYPNTLYIGEETDSIYQSAYPKVFQEPLTAELMEHHQNFSEACKP